MRSGLSTLPPIRSQELTLPNDTLSTVPASPFPLAELPSELIGEIVARLAVSDPVAVFKLYLAYLPNKEGNYCKNPDRAGRIERVIRPFISPLALTGYGIATRNLKFDISENEEDRISLHHLKFLAKQLNNPVLSTCYKLLTNRDFNLTVDYAMLSTPHAIEWANRGLIDFSRLNIQMNGSIEGILNNFTSLRSSYSEKNVLSLQEALVRTGLDSLEKLFNVGGIDVAEDVYQLWFKHACFKRERHLATSIFGLFVRRQGLSLNGEELSESQRALQTGYWRMKERAEVQFYNRILKFGL